MMELQWIEDFLALCATRNFTRAAQARCTTQSAYSRRVQRLEEWLGAPLFYRETRPVALTPAGEAFLGRARRLREEIFDSRRAALSASSNFKSAVRIYATNTIAASFLPQWLTTARFGAYSLIVASIAGCVEAVRRGDADLCVVPHFDGDDVLLGLNVEEAAVDGLVLAALNPGAITLKNKKLSGSIMLYTPGTTYGAQIFSMLSQNDIELAQPPVCESASAEALVAQAKAGLGAAWAPKILLNGSGLARCDVPKFFDIPYRILKVSSRAGPGI